MLVEGSYKNINTNYIMRNVQLMYKKCLSFWCAGFFFKDQINTVYDKNY